MIKDPDVTATEIIHYGHNCITVDTTDIVIWLYTNIVVRVCVAVTNQSAYAGIVVYDWLYYVSRISQYT